MLFDYTYKGSTAVHSYASRTDMSFAPDVKREPAYFWGELKKSVEFREAISALHDVVISDLRFKPKDKTAYKEWAAQREAIDWQQVAAERADVGARVKQMQQELDSLNRLSYERMKPYYEARQKFALYAWRKNLDVRYILDPVITVHPDEVFFECFSLDESSYGRLGASFEVFGSVGEFACGTTNIDYSAALYDEFQKIRSYKTTRFEIDPSGFDVQTSGEEAYKEVKIDLPDSWVRGFLQVSSAMALDTVSFELEPMDVHNLCFVLRRHKERQGPRSMRYHLTPGRPVRVVFEPWNIEVTCPRSIYAGREAQEIRVWGRRRIHILERLIPVARKFTVHLLGSGLPSFYVADLGDMSFTLGLSGWTANDWSRA
ncbi:MAG TPA: SWIM zinc finger family protein, partial [Blastocatellia bacterium]|nr:SWIM zinc finger family protein [Blastocatellia bacterium]